MQSDMRNATGPHFSNIEAMLCHMECGKKKKKCCKKYKKKGKTHCKGCPKL